MLAQALIEKGVLDSVAAGASMLKYQVMQLGADGRWLWVAGAILCVALTRPFWKR